MPAVRCSFFPPETRTRGACPENTNPTRAKSSRCIQREVCPKSSEFHSSRLKHRTVGSKEDGQDSDTLLHSLLYRPRRPVSTRSGRFQQRMPQMPVFDLSQTGSELVPDIWLFSISPHATYSLFPLFVTIVHARLCHPLLVFYRYRHALPCCSLSYYPICSNALNCTLFP